MIRCAELLTFPHDQILFSNDIFICAEKLQNAPMAARQRLNAVPRVWEEVLAASQPQSARPAARRRRRRHVPALRQRVRDVAGAGAPHGRGARLGRRCCLAHRSGSSDADRTERLGCQSTERPGWCAAVGRYQILCVQTVPAAVRYLPRPQGALAISQKGLSGSPPSTL